MNRPDLSQANTIDIINDYLKWNNFPLKWNKEGVCHGLALIHTKYTIEDKEDVFFSMLDKIARFSHKENLYPLSESGYDDINHFIAQVVLAFDPGDFDKTYRQHNAYKTVMVDSRPLQTDFILPLITTREHWAGIFKSLDLQPGEVGLLSSPNHTISLHREKGKYVVYDPNYYEGKKTFKSEAALVKELTKNVFHFEDGTMIMTLNILQKEGYVPNATARPSPLDILKNELLKNPDARNAETHFNDHAITQIDYAALTDNKAILELLLQPKDDLSEEELDRIGGRAILNDNADNLSVLLDKSQEVTEKNLNVMEHWITFALSFGSKQCFDKLIKNPVGKIAMEKLINDFPRELLVFAAKGGNPDLLTSMTTMQQSKEGFLIHLHKDDSPELILHPRTPIDSLHDNSSISASEDSPNLLSGKPSYAIHPVNILHCNYKKENVITAIIDQGSVECLDIALKKLKEENLPLGNDEMKEYLLMAIRRNNPYIVTRLVEQHPQEMKDILSKVTMSIKLAHKTDLSILRLLQDNNARLSPAVINVIKEKESHSLSFITILGIKLASFTEFIKQTMGLQKDLAIKDNPDAPASSESKTLSFKERNLEQRRTLDEAAHLSSESAVAEEGIAQPTP